MTGEWSMTSRREGGLFCNRSGSMTTAATIQGRIFATTVTHIRENALRPGGGRGVGRGQTGRRYTFARVRHIIVIRVGPGPGNLCAGKKKKKAPAEYAFHVRNRVQRTTEKWPVAVKTE